MNVEAIQAGATVKFNIPGRNFRLIETTGPVNVTFYRRGAEIAESVQVEAGYSEKWEQDSEGFEQVEFYSATAQTIKFAVRMESSVSYDRAVGNVAVTNVGGPFTHSNPSVPVASSLVVAANAARRYLMIQNKDVSLEIYVRTDSAAGILNGLKVGPGDSLEFQGYVPTGSIYIGSPGGINSNVVVVQG